MQFLHIKTINFFKKFWWVWLILLVVSITVLVIGPSVVGSFIYKLFSVLFTIWILGSFVWFTIGRGNMDAWGLLRLTGIIGAFASIYLCINTMRGFSFHEIFWNADNAVRRSNFIVFSAAGICSLILVGLGEISFYLYKVNYKLRRTAVLQVTNNENIRKLANEAICPRCIGKGWVDKSDIERLGMEDKEPGICIFCEGTGHVERGHTNEYDPRENQEYHEKMEEKRRKIWEGREEEQVALEKEFEEFKKQYDQEQKVSDV